MRDIPVVLCSDESYAPYVGVVFRSIIEHASENNQYRLFVLENGFSEKTKSQLHEIVDSQTNFSLELISLRPYLEEQDLSSYPISKQFSQAIYYRFFIPRIFSHLRKVIYLDSDVIVLSDIAELYDAPIGNHIIGATLDLGIPRMLALDPAFKQYIEQIGIQYPEHYFQSGVLVMNVEKMRENHFEQICFEHLSKMAYLRFPDQDILNKLYSEDIAIITQDWNVLWHVMLANDLNRFVNASLYYQQLKATHYPKILHYSGERKPWQFPQLKLAEKFWEIARHTPFYNQLVEKLLRLQPE